MSYSFIRSFSRACSLMLVCILLGLSAVPAAHARFITPDTWDPTLLGVDINRYAYSGNDPVNGSDANGHAIDPKENDISDSCNTACDAKNEAREKAAEEARKQAEMARENEIPCACTDIAHPGASGGPLHLPSSIGGPRSTGSEVIEGNRPANIRSNAAEGLRRENSATSTLREQYPDKNVTTQRTLRDSQGKKLVDPKTGEGRRVDNAVMDKQTKTAKTYEVTGPKVRKAPQQEKEGRIFDQNPSGVYVREPISGDLYSVTQPSERFDIP